ncbi:MAG: protein-disulfide reductase DsbD domain-containing protein [Bacteroidota bacterium]
MKKILLSLSLVVMVYTGFGQENHVSWGYEVKKKTADKYDVTITAEIEHPWHLYSQHASGPGRTSFVFKANPLITKTGVVKEVGNLEKTIDKSVGETLSYSGKVQFVQTVKVKGNVKTNISGAIQYVVCDESHCLPTKKNLLI